MTPLVSMRLFNADIDDLWRRYVRRVGAPRSVPCAIELGHPGPDVWICMAHEVGFQTRKHLLDGRLNDRCPVARLEEWRARRWEAAA